MFKIYPVQQVGKRIVAHFRDKMEAEKCVARLKGRIGIPIVVYDMNDFIYNDLTSKDIREVERDILGVSL